MKTIEIDNDIYQHIARNTEFIGESASDILRRLLGLHETDQSLATSTVDLAPEPEEDTAELKQEVEKPTVSVSTGNVFDYINKEELAIQRGAVGRFLLILAALYRIHADEFDKVLEIRGRDRLYFATSEQALSESGSSTKPRLIPGSTYWVMTNSNTTRKKMMLTEAAKAFGYASNDIEKIRDLL